MFGLDTEEHHSCRILALKDIAVPARTEFVARGIPAKEGKSFRFGVTDFPDTERFPRGVLVGATLIDVSREIVPVRLANINDGTRVIRKGEEIAKCSAVTSIEQRAAETFAVPVDDLMEQLIGDTQLDREQKTIARSLIQEFQDVFSSSSKDMGRTRLTQHRIDTGTHPPIKHHPRRLPISKQEGVEKLLKEMEENDVIEPSSSPWASPIVLIRKKDGSTRFCVDYRKLNDVTKKDGYPLPRIDVWDLGSILDTLSGNKWFSTLGLKSGYCQVEIHPDDSDSLHY